MSTLVLYPSPLVGHLVSMVELAKIILKHHPHSFSNITVLITSTPNFQTGSTAPYIATVSAATPAIIFHHLPATTPPQISAPSPEARYFEFLKHNNPNVREALQTISKSSKIKAFVIDVFCNAAFEVSRSFNIPTYYFFTTSASNLSSLLYLPVIHKSTTRSFKDLNSFLNYPGLPPIFSSDVSSPLLDRNSAEYKCFLETATQMAESCGIIVNTFESIEPRVITAISEGLCIPNVPTPPIYCIGPLIATDELNCFEHECLKWLDSQPSKSVVFLNFGSLGVFGVEQLKEMAIGLENSGHRFLWVVLNPLESNHGSQAVEEPDLDVLLPKGFLERTKGRGLVVTTWVPQVAVLSHDSVGGFVTHCGWNSVLEAVWAGVAMIGWPLYAEQRMNRVVLAEEMKLGLNLEESGDDRFVSGAELEKRVRELMDSESGEVIRRRVIEMRDAATAAIEKDKGTSRIALAKLVAKWKE